MLKLFICIWLIKALKVSTCTECSFICQNCYC